MLDRATQVSVDNQCRITALSADEGEVCDRGRLAFAGTAADERDGVGFGIGAIEFDVGPQNSIRFSVRRVAFGFVQQIDVLRNDREDRNTEKPFDSRALEFMECMEFMLPAPLPSNLPA